MNLRLLVLGGWLCLRHTAAYAQQNLPAYDHLSFREQFQETATANVPALAAQASIAATALAPAAMPLPIQLAGQAEPDGRVRLRWQVGPTQCSEVFLVERATDELLWQQVAQVNGSDTTHQKNEYEYIDSTPARLGHYRLFCLHTNGTRAYSATLSVFNTRKTGQAVQYYVLYPTTLTVGFDTSSLVFPVTANLYGKDGKLLCYETLAPQANALSLDLPATPDATIKLQLVDGTHRVLTTRVMSMAKTNGK
jgi:hypothetical protein